MDPAAAPPFDPVRHRRGGRPRKAPEQRRAHQLNIRLTPEEWAAGEAKAGEAGLTLAEYGRLALNQSAVTVEIAPIPSPEIMRELRIIGRNLWQAIEDGRRCGFPERRQAALEDAAASVGERMRTLWHGPER